LPSLIVAWQGIAQQCPEKVLLGGAALVVEPHHHPVRLHRQVGDDEADTREQLARMPFDLGNHTARLVPGRGLILEVL
jgi:hypothetical protein